MDVRERRVAEIAVAIGAGFRFDKSLAEIERGHGSAYAPQGADAGLRLFRERGYVSVT